MTVSEGIESPLKLTPFCSATTSIGLCAKVFKVRNNKNEKIIFDIDIALLIFALQIYIMIPYWMSRTQLMLGDENMNKLMGKNVLVIGLGGVGGICAEMIVRAGVGKITIVDNDTVDKSNINRQIPALHSTAGMPKAQVLAQRLKDINPALDLTVNEIFVKDDITKNLLRKRSMGLCSRLYRYLVCQSFFNQRLFG